MWATRPNLTHECVPKMLKFSCNLNECIPLASGKDRIFPSIAEARRLMQEVPTCKLHVAPDSGHAVLLEEGTCLAGAYTRSHWSST